MLLIKHIVIQKKRTVMNDLPKVAEQIVEAVNKTKNNYDAKEIVLDILTKENENYKSQIKENGYAKI